jgi:hypothetical protein
LQQHHIVKEDLPSINIRQKLCLFFRSYYCIYIKYKKIQVPKELTEFRGRMKITILFLCLSKCLIGMEVEENIQKQTKKKKKKENNSDQKYRIKLKSY